MISPSQKTNIQIWKQHHRNADWWALKCEDKGQFNNLIKQVEGRRWSATWNAWLIPADKKMNPEIRKKLQDGFELVFLNGEKAEANKKVETGKAFIQNDLEIKTPIRFSKPYRSAHAISNTKASLEEKPSLTSTQPKKPRFSTENQKAMAAYERELVLKGFSPNTQRTYTAEFANYLTILKGIHAKAMSPDRIKDYLYYCAQQLKLSEATLHSRINALKFYYEQVLGREKFFWEVPRPKKPKQNPSLFNQDEIAAIIKGTENSKHKAMLMVAYSSGLRVSEVVALKPTDIDSKRMCLHIRQGKGKKDRMVSLSPVLLVMLREYWQQCAPKPKVYLFEGQEGGSQYSTRSLQQVLHQAKERANIYKKGSIHALRHSFATHLLDKGTDVSLIMKLLGHNDIKTTLRYLHVSNRDILQIVSPLDTLAL